MRSGTASAWIIAGTIVVLTVLWLFARPLGLLVLAITLAEALLPLIERMQRWMPRTLSVVLTYVVLAGAVALIAWIVVPRITSEFAGLNESFDQLVTQFQSGGSGLLNDVASAAASILSRFAGKLATATMAVGSAAVEVVAVLFLSIYLLIEGPAVRAFLASLFPRDSGHERRDTFLCTLEAMGEHMGGYVRGAALNAVIVGLLGWVGLWILGVRDPFLIGGVIGGLGEMVPYVGPFLVGGLAVAVALLDSRSKALAVLVLYIAIQQIEGHLLTPTIMRTQTELPAGLVLFAFTAGALVGGPLGAIASIPLAAALRVFVVDVVADEIRHRLARRSRQVPVEAPADGH